MKKAEKLLLLAIVIVVGLIWYFWVREDFTSKAQIDSLIKKVANARLENDPDVKSLNTQPAITQIQPENQRSIGVGLRYGFPLGIIAVFGDVQNDTFDVKASFIDTVLSGGFDTSKFTAANLIAVLELAGGKPVQPQEKENMIKNERFGADFAKALYHSLTRGGCPSGLLEQVAKICNNAQTDRNFSPAVKPWTQVEKDLIRKIAGKAFNIVPDTPLAPPVPPPSAVKIPPTPAPSMASGSAYAASCTKCTLVNNQLSCSCDVTPR